MAGREAENKTDAKAGVPALTHGGDWAGFEMEFGRAPLDFSMNVNPLGIPDGVKAAIAEAAGKADRYPDPACRRLREALAAHEEVPEEWIFCGNGAADIIDRIALGLTNGPSRALVTAPTFAEYEEALIRCGWAVDYCPLEEGAGFALTEKILPMITSDTGIMFLCEPNNPTGITTDRALLKKILDRCRETKTTVVVDECFNGFLDEPNAHTIKAYLRDHPNLIILKAFTKLYAMAGVRLGYCLCADGERLAAIREAGQPWNVSLLAEEAGLAALNERAYVEEMRRLIPAERVWLKEQLEMLGITPIYGEANYLLFRAETEADLDEELRREGFLIRNCANYRGLGAGWWRIAVRSHEENEELIRAMGRIMK